MSRKASSSDAGPTATLNESKTALTGLELARYGPKFGIYERIDRSVESVQVGVQDRAGQSPVP